MPRTWLHANTTTHTRLPLTRAPRTFVDDRRKLCSDVVVRFCLPRIHHLRDDSGTHAKFSQRAKEPLAFTQHLRQIISFDAEPRNGVTYANGFVSAAANVSGAQYLERCGISVSVRLSEAAGRLPTMESVALVLVDQLPTIGQWAFASFVRLTPAHNEWTQ